MGVCTMSSLHPGVSGRKSTSHKSPDPSDDPIAALPPFVSQTRTAEVLCISRATLWRCLKDGRLQAASGSGKIIKASIQRFAQPR
jgi:hypothetical protein